MLLYIVLLVAYVFVRNLRVRATISGIVTLLSLLTFLAVGGLLNFVILALWGYFFYRDLRSLR